jgi:N-acyl-D-amino-acid deacylase
MSYQVTGDRATSSPRGAAARIVPLLQVGIMLLSCWITEADAAEPAFDLVLRGGRIVDGTGAPWYVADVGIRQGKITKIGRIEAAAGQTSIDVTGLVVAPGFIDMMGQTASPMVEDPKSAMNLLTQGITTINAGEGASAAPLSKDDEKRQGWTTMSEYFALLDMNGLPVNVVQTVGHTQVRRMIIGDVERRPSPDELKKMQDLVREGMEAGAIGVSTALIYPPAVYASTEEIAALAKVAGESGGKYYTHMRNEGDQLLGAIEEALEIGRQGNTPVHIFHLKTAGRQNWGKMPLAIAKIKAARAAGQQVGADIYPYINNGLEIAALIHPRHFAEGAEKFRRRLSDDAALRKEVRTEIETTGGWENWYRHVGQDWDKIVIGQTNDSRYRDVVGQSVAAIAKAKNEDPWDTFFNLVKAGSFALPQSMTEANKILAMQQEFVSFCTDVGPAGNDQFVSHPRASGSFPRLFSRYVRDLGAISLERAVAQASAVAANEVLAYDRGRIAEGLAADLCVFDYNKLADKATFDKPATLSEGMLHVVVNGTLVLQDGKYTGKRPGRVLRGPGYRLDKAPAVITTGKQDPRLANFDRLLHDFIEHHRVSGAALAVTDQGRLVYARGYGYADLATHEPVQPTSLFRIASVSKPITAVAVLQLIEQSKLKLDDKVYEVLDYKTDIEKAGAEFDVRQRDITIRHLLEHRGGWDREKSFDAMFEPVKFAQQQNVPAPAGPQDIIRVMLRHKLDFAPGERYAYSNFGYCLLGRVIEKLTGMPYEAYVKEKVLAPLGIHTMRLGASRLEGRAPGEVRYYQPGTAKSVFQADLNQDVPWQYGGWNLEAMDAHGGWIASAVDLARFAAAFDDPAHCPILSAASIELMHGRPPGLAAHDEAGKPKDVYYSLGWSNRVTDGKVGHWHTGSLSGTATIVIRRSDGRNLVVLLNTRVSPQSEHLSRDIDGLIQKAASSITDWPQENRFAEFP